jgi:hypothetical protein
MNRDLYEQHKRQVAERHLQRYSGKFYKDIIRECELYGTDHRTIFNMTPLMMAAQAGNTALVRELLDGGADAELVDNRGFNAWQNALLCAAEDDRFTAESFPALNEMLAPSAISLKVDDRLIKIDERQGEFLLFHVAFVLLRSRISGGWPELAAVTAVKVSEVMASLPDSVVPPYRKKRSYISALLSKNERECANPYCRKLFQRKRQGNYILNPRLYVRQKEEWVDINRLANMDLLIRTGENGDTCLREEILSVISDDDASRAP